MQRVAATSSSGTSALLFPPQASLVTPHTHGSSVAFSDTCLLLVKLEYFSLPTLPFSSLVVIFHPYVQ